MKSKNLLNAYVSFFLFRFPVADLKQIKYNISDTQWIFVISTSRKEQNLYSKLGMRSYENQ